MRFPVRASLLDVVVALLPERGGHERVAVRVQLEHAPVLMDVADRMGEEEAAGREELGEGRRALERRDGRVAREREQNPLRLSFSLAGPPPLFF